MYSFVLYAIVNPWIDSIQNTTVHTVAPVMICHHDMMRYDMLCYTMYSDEGDEAYPCVVLIDLIS